MDKPHITLTNNGYVSLNKDIASSFDKLMTTKTLKLRKSWLRVGGS